MLRKRNTVVTQTATGEEDEDPRRGVSIPRNEAERPTSENRASSTATLAPRGTNTNSTLEQRSNELLSIG